MKAAMRFVQAIASHEGDAQVVIQVRILRLNTEGLLVHGNSALFISLKNILKKDNRFFTNMTNIVAFQKIDEDRNSRKFRNPELLTLGEGVTNILSGSTREFTE